MKHIFTYGSLMFAPVWESIVAGTYLQYKARLSGFVRRCIDNEDYPAIVPGRISAVVKGILYLDISAEDMARLDQFEGSIYLRQHVQVSTENNIFAADAYVLRHEYRHLLSRKTWCPEEFEKTGLAKFLDSYSGFQR
jgi:gamma-glutamylcyclotransferase (GGCT)/AIG2-like uncharacterized protein YtfP